MKGQVFLKRVELPASLSPGWQTEPHCTPASGPSHTELLSGQAYNPGTWELPRQDEPPLAIGSCCPGRKKGRPSCAPVPTGKPTIVLGCLSFTCFRGIQVWCSQRECRTGDMVTTRQPGISQSALGLPSHHMEG